MIERTTRVLFCKQCKMTFGRLESMDNYKDESNFLCDQCDQPDSSKREDSFEMNFLQSDGSIKIIESESINGKQIFDLRDAVLGTRQ